MLSKLNLAKLGKIIAEHGKTNPKAEGILARLAAMKQESDVSGRPVTNSVNSGAVRLINGVRITGLLLSVECKENKKKNEFGGSNVHTVYELYVLDVGRQPIDKSDGRRIDDSTIELHVQCEQRMNPQELGAFHQGLTDAGIAESNPQWKRKKRDFRLGTKTLSAGEKCYITVFNAPFKDGNTNLAPGTVVIIRGILPKQDYLMSVETGALGDPSYGTKWEISQMIRDSSGRNVNLAEIWHSEEAKNYFPRISPTFGFGEHNMTPEETEIVQKAAAKGKMTGTDKWRKIFFKIPSETRGHVNSLFVLPMGSANVGIQPFHFVGHSVLIMPPQFTAKEWVVEETENKEKKKIRTGRFSAEVQLYTDGEAHEKVVIYGSLSEKILKEKMNKFGMVSVERWENLARLLMDGYLVMKLDLITTSDLKENDPSVNTQDEDGKFALGYSCGAVYTTDIIEPNVARAVVDNGYEINSETAITLIRAAFGTGDLALNAPDYVVANAKKNLLKELSGGEPIINLMEATKSVPSLVREDYVLFVLYGVDRTLMTKWMARITGATAEAKFEEFNRLMRETDDNFLGFPRPNVEDPNTYCVFAIRRAEVVRHRTPPPPLTEEQLAVEIFALQATQEKRELQQAAQLRQNLEAVVNRVVDDEPEPAAAAHVVVQEAPVIQAHAEPPKTKVRKEVPAAAPAPAPVKRGKGKQAAARVQEDEDDLPLV
jgi:hypothetical protein